MELILQLRAALVGSAKWAKATKTALVTGRTNDASKEAVVPVSVTIAGNTFDLGMIPIRIEKDGEGACALHFRDTFETGPLKGVETRTKQAKAEAVAVNLDELLAKGQGMGAILELELD